MQHAPIRRAVLFDADGVLVDSHRGYRTVWERWAQFHGLDPSLVHAATHARRPLDTVADVAPYLDAVREYERLVEYVAALPEAFGVFAGAPELLSSLPADRWGVVTSGDAASVRARLTAGAAPVPTVLVDGAAVRRGKPDPEGYLLGAELLQVPAADCLVVEDAPAGIQAARAAGMRVVGLTTSHPAADLAQAHVVVGSLGEARGHLLDWIARGQRS